MSQLNNELTKDNQQSQQFYTSQIQKDILVQNTCSVFQIICAYIYEEIFISKNQNSINIPNLEQNKQILQNIITVGQQSFQQLTFLLLELCFMCEGTHLYLQLQNSLFTCFLIDPNMFHEVKNKYILQQLFSGNEQSVVYQKITERMSQIFADIQPLNDQYNNDLFYNNFKFVIQQFKKETQTINVEQNQQSKISIHY
ncbi:hypothetical protein PPERSA_06606 [Pseudocohnilembus persalinus]|uniref:Uncharacterized protein n=1 Tax=Pseudocohnilembus persalinus TaxID=266149 RepID=A0A0V0QRX4_PSEPJ|nr:hypothetical protein PPERSA_06606 [Pseudocohnilembus persalinus]|eukprot:KRX04972.1 hypothetical protein PPERSA_06606 [Pseudocohnilembus persalinus]